VSKFVGKFRKNQDYNEDYDYARNFLHSKRRRSEHAEVKKIKNNEYEDNYEYEEYEDKMEIKK
jgi:hypothetical protein